MQAQFDASKSDEALMELYRRLSDRNAPAEGSFSTLTAAERREYFRIASRASRSRQRHAKADGRPLASAGNVRAALADAALLILATGAPGADEVRTVLAQVFEGRPGIPVTVEQRARAGRMRPKILKVKR